MKHIILLCLSICIVYFSYAQSTVSNIGEELSNSQGNIIFTIGEPIIETLNNNDTTILQGFHQTLVVAPVSIQEIEEWEISVFPNPAQHIVNVEWNNQVVQSLSYVLTDINGKLITQGKNKETFSIDVQQYASGTYFLSLKDNENQTQIFNIQKIK